MATVTMMVKILRGLLLVFVKTKKAGINTREICRWRQTSTNEIYYITTYLLRSHKSITFRNNRSIWCRQHLTQIPVGVIKTPAGADIGKKFEI